VDDSAESLDYVFQVRRKGERIASERAKNMADGYLKLSTTLDRAPSGRARVVVRMTDAAGDEARDSARVELP
jgi:hypothetical protein